MNADERRCEKSGLPSSAFICVHLRFLLSAVGIGTLAPSMALTGCRRQAVTAQPAAPTAIRFVDATAEAGIRFRHTHGGFGKKLLPETVGSGVAWLDYDGDGWQDLLFVNCRPLPGADPGLRPPTTRFPPLPPSAGRPPGEGKGRPPGPPIRERVKEGRSERGNDGARARSLVHSFPPSLGSFPTPALYRNRGDGTFEDRTHGSGLDVMLYGQGVSAADYDADGDADVFITCLGPNHLFRNDGGRKFTDVTATAGLGDGPDPWRYHGGSAWLDYDRDGWLDLFVTRYVKWTPETDPFCGAPGGTKRYCPPWKSPREHCAFYRNLGNGRFRDVSRETGIAALDGYWFQPLALDTNDDGWPDVAVICDGTPMALYRNEQGRRFTDVAPEAGISVSETGSPKSQMGIDACDWRNDGREAMLVGNFSGERLSLFEEERGEGVPAFGTPALPAVASGAKPRAENTPPVSPPQLNMEAGDLYSDVADRVGMGQSSLYSLTFAVAFLDADLDGWRDAFIANGHIDDYIERFDSNVTYAQRPLFYHNEKGQRFTQIGAGAGPAFDRKLVARGCAIADYDQDGDPDVVVTENNGPARLYRNDTAAGSRYLCVHLRGKVPNTHAIGARVRVTAGGIRQNATVRAGGHFYSQSEVLLTFGVGSATTADVTVTWPRGGTTERKAVATGQTLMIAE